MIYPTTEEEKRAFYQAALPGFLEYLRSHMSAIEQVELAETREGIVSFPATQVLGGVQKTVRVPLSLLTAGCDSAAENAREATEDIREREALLIALIHKFIQNPPEVGANRNWWIYDLEHDEMVDTGKLAEQLMLYIDFDYDFDSGELTMEYVDVDGRTFVGDMVSFDNGDIVFGAANITQ